MKRAVRPKSLAKPEDSGAIPPGDDVCHRNWPVPFGALACRQNAPIGAANQEDAPARRIRPDSGKRQKRAAPLFLSRRRDLRQLLGKAPGGKDRRPCRFDSGPAKPAQNRAQTTTARRTLPHRSSNTRTQRSSSAAMSGDNLRTRLHRRYHPYLADAHRRQQRMVMCTVRTTFKSIQCKQHRVYTHFGFRKRCQSFLGPSAKLLAQDH